MPFKEPWTRLSILLHNETQQATTEPLLHRYEMRNSERHWTLYFLSGTAHTHTFSTGGAAIETHWRNSECSMASASHPTEQCCAGCCAQLVVFHKTRESTFKNRQNDYESWSAAFSDMLKRTNTNHHFQMLLWILSSSLGVSKTRGRKKQTKKLYR